LTLLRKRPVRSILALSILIVAAIATSSLAPTSQEVTSPTPSVKPQTETLPTIVTPQTKTPSQEQFNELRLSGVILRSSGDTNPFLGTPWIYVSCFGYVGEPVIAIQIEDHIEIYDYLRETGLKCGQNIVYTGQEEKPAGSPIKMLVEWDKQGRTVCIDSAKLIVDRKTGKTLAELDESWIFLGSYITAGELDSEDTGCIACTVNCPMALFAANKDDSGYYRERSRYYIPEGILPEPGTEVTVIITWA
jgi:hypothetical protein